MQFNAMPTGVAAACWLLCASAVQAEEADTTTLPSVVVTATMSERDRLASPAFTTVVTKQDIEKVPVNSLPDLLRDTVGVANVSDGNGRDELQIRGMDGKYTLILVNGKRMSSSGALWRGSDFDLSAVPLSSIERIEIVRGPMSALYGSDAIGGVVNIITKRPGQDWHGEVGVDYRVVDVGSKGDQWRLNAAANGALTDALALSVSGEYYNREAWFLKSSSDPTEAPALEAKNSANFMSTLTARLNDQQSLDIDLGYNHDKRPYGLNDYTYYPAYNYESYSYSEQMIDRYTLAVTHNGSWSWGKTFTSLKREQSDIDDWDTDYDDPQQRHYKENNTYLRSFGVVHIGPQELTGGVDFRNQKITDTATYLDSGKDSTNTSALFAQDEIKLGEDWLLTLGGRLDHHPDFGNHFSPKAYLNYFVTEGVVIKGGASTAFKAPDPYQLSKEYRIVSCGGSCYLSGNPDLKPEKDTSYELGVELTQRGWNLSAVYFHNKMKDMIVAVYDASVPSRTWTNVSQAKTSGLELDGGVKLSKTVSFKGNLTLMKADATDETGANTKLENRPEQKAMLGLEWNPVDPFTASLAVNYIGQQYYEDIKLPAYTRIDLGGALKVGRALSLRAGVKNLTNVNLKDKNENFVGNELGRNVYVAATYAF